MYFFTQPQVLLVCRSFLRVRLPSAARGLSSGDRSLRSPPQKNTPTSFLRAVRSWQPRLLRSASKRSDRCPMRSVTCVFCCSFVVFHGHGGFKERNHSDPEKDARSLDEHREELADAGAKTSGIAEVP